MSKKTVHSTSESMVSFASSINSTQIFLTIVEYAGTMDFYAYANKTEFVGVKLNDTPIPPPLSGSWVQGYAFSMSEVQHEADSIIGNRLVHGDAANLDAQINANIAGWFNGVSSTFFNARYKGHSVHPANLIAGDNHFDVSISNNSSTCSVTFAIQHIANGAITNLALVQLTASRPGWAHDFKFA